MPDSADSGHFGRRAAGRPEAAGAPFCGPTNRAAYDADSASRSGARYGFSAPSIRATRSTPAHDARSASRMERRTDSIPRSSAKRNTCANFAPVARLVAGQPRHRPAPPRGEPHFRDRNRNRRTTAIRLPAIPPQRLRLNVSGHCSLVEHRRLIFPGVSQSTGWAPRGRYRASQGRCCGGAGAINAGFGGFAPSAGAQRAVLEPLGRRSCLRDPGRSRDQ